VKNLVALMAEDVTFGPDGGGQVVAARKRTSKVKARFLNCQFDGANGLPQLTPPFVQIN